MSFEEIDRYACPTCGHKELMYLCGWGGPPKQLRCPICHEMMDLQEQSKDGSE